MKATFEERFWVKVNKTETCWLWISGVDREGYGRFWTGGGNTRRAHRVAYELVVGPIPDGLTLDHLCRVPACVNPDHLEPVTAAVNGLRGDTYQGINARRTHCIHGHPFSGDNLYVQPNGRRTCRTCRIMRKRAARAKQREEKDVTERVKIATAIEAHIGHLQAVPSVATDLRNLAEDVRRGRFA